jgi:hypothetical protein
VTCEALNQARRDIFDGHDILPEGFVWYLPQIIRFLQQETDQALGTHGPTEVNQTDVLTSQARR